MIARAHLAVVMGACLAVMLPAATRADTVVATCTTGGCECTVSPLTAEEILVVMEGTIPSDGSADPTAETLVYEPRSGVVSWVDASGRDVHASFGGAGDCPVTAYPAPEALAPLDGTWRWRTLGEATSGCPAALGGMLAASRVEFMSTQVQWDGAFAPDRLLPILPQPDAPGILPYEWRETGEYRWMSDNVRSRECRDGACAEMALVLNMILIAPDRISGILSLHSAVDAPQVAIMAGFGLADCRVRVRYDIVRTGS